MHPSRAIKGRRSTLLAGRRIILAITGSIAAVEVPRIVRELLRHGAEVSAVMSPDAARIITPEAIHFATGSFPVLSLSGAVEHVTELGPGEGRADLLLVAPATANTIGKIAHGIDDTAVTSFVSVALGGGVPVLVAPAMHAHMALNPAVQDNLATLRRYGVEVVASQSAEGEEKLASPEEVAAAVLHRLGRGPWIGRNVLVIGGASREPIDDVRSITNESSGETAVALGTQAYYRGANVTMWLGAMQVPVPSFLPAERWGSTRDLTRLIDRSRTALTAVDSVWVPAALSDYTLEPFAGKLVSRGKEVPEVALRKAEKVLPRLRARSPMPRQLVAFKLTSRRSVEDLLEEARRLQAESGADFVIANDRAAMGAPRAAVWLVGRGSEPRSFEGDKMSLAGELLDAVGATLPRASPKRRRVARPRTAKGG
jgi:phosphopantothenoylcysteine decarboxylase / phosphopantothenate---cysteine ligase